MIKCARLCGVEKRDELCIPPSSSASSFRVLSAGIKLKCTRVDATCAFLSSGVSTAFETSAPCRYSSRASSSTYWWCICAGRGRRICLEKQQKKTPLIIYNPCAYHLFSFPKPHTLIHSLGSKSLLRLLLPVFVRSAHPMASSSATLEDAASTTFAIAVKWQGKQFTVSLPEVPFVFSFFAHLPHFPLLIEVSPPPLPVADGGIPFALLLLCRAESSLVFFLSQEADVACLKRVIEVRV